VTEPSISRCCVTCSSEHRRYGSEFRVSGEIQSGVERPEAVCQINVAAVVGVTGPGFDLYTSKRYKWGLNFC
jgi:hypothetical protein